CAGEAAVPLISTWSPAVNGRRQYSTSFQQPVDSSEPMLPLAVASCDVSPESWTPGRTSGAVAIDVPPAAAAAPTTTKAEIIAEAATATRRIHRLSARSPAVVNRAADAWS